MKARSAPPVYRPHVAPAIRSGASLAAPPIYRPNRAAVAAPNAYRPGGVTGTLQQMPRAAPPVYRPAMPTSAAPAVYRPAAGVQRRTANAVQRVTAGSVVRVRDSSSAAHGRLGFVRAVNEGVCAVAWNEDSGARFLEDQLEEPNILLGYHQTVHQVTAWDESRARTGHAMGSGDASSRENELGDGVYVLSKQWVGDYDDEDRESNVYEVRGFSGVNYGMVKDSNGHQSVLKKNLRFLQFVLHSRRPSIRSRVTVGISSTATSLPTAPQFTGQGEAPTNADGKKHYSIF